MLFTRTVKHVFISDGLADEIGGRLGSIFKRPTSNGFCWLSEMSISAAIGVGRLLVQYFQHISRPFTQMDVLVIVKNRPGIRPLFISTKFLLFLFGSVWDKTGKWRIFFAFLFPKKSRTWRRILFCRLALR